MKEVICTKCKKLRNAEKEFPVRKERKTLSPHKPCYECRRKLEVARRANRRVARQSSPLLQEATC